MNLTRKQMQAIQGLQAEGDWKWKEFLGALEAAKEAQRDIAAASPNSVDIYRAQGGARELGGVLSAVYKSNEWKLQ